MLHIVDSIKTNFTILSENLLI